MKFQPSVVRNSLFILVVMAALAGVRASAQTTPNTSVMTQAGTAVQARITQAIDEAEMVQLKGNVHPLARAEFDQGAAPANLPMERMLLMLRRSPEQESALEQLMVDQYNTASPNFHKWLTPEQFGSQFGPADSDIQTVTSWLVSHGFQVAKVSKGKIAVEFSGTAAQVKETFGTEIRKFVVNGEEHWANSSDPQIPAALEPVVNGFAALHNFHPKPMHRVAGQFSKSESGEIASNANPQFTTSGGNFAIGPTDFATIYNVQPLWTAGTDGSGQHIAIIGVSNINLQDVVDFRTLFGLPTNQPANIPNVIIDGTDPGILTDGSETEGLLDVQWSGAVAKGAQIDFVIAADTNDASGLILAALHVIDYNLAPIMSLSFGSCELHLGSGGNGALNSFWQQSAAQGITVTVSSGDNGSAGCEDFNAKAPHPATTGLQVSGFASTPFNVAVGGTDFNDAGAQSTYFNATNDPTTLASAKGYIPESTWNESCTNASFGGNAEANCNSTATANAAAVITVGGNGGKSHCTTVTGTTCSGGYAKPLFQMLSGLTGMPADGKRDIPDVSLFASSGFNKSFYVVCEAAAVPGVSCNKSGSFSFLGVGGTSASTPAFAGILALVNQKQATVQNPTPRQGNANFVLYQLAKAQYAAGTICNSVASPLPAATCTFNDTTTGTIAMPCTKGSPDCTTNVATDTRGVLSGFSTNTGYDLATGLGSVNVTNLVNNWSTGLAALTASTTALALNNGNPVNITHGAKVPVQITVTGSGGTPTGHVSLVSTATTGQGVDGFDLVSGSLPANTTTNQLTGSSPAGVSYLVHAHYPGDGTFGPSDSATVSVIVSPQPSLTVASIFADNKGTAFVPGTYPQTAFLRADVGESPTISGNFIASGTVDFVDRTTMTLASNVGISTESAAFVGPIVLNGGANSIVAKYSGDPSFIASNSAALTFTITPAVSTTTGTGPASVPTGQSATLTASVQTQALAPAAAPTGTITFKNGAATVGSASVSGVAGGASGATAAASFSATFNVAGVQTLTAVYSGDINYAGSTSASFTVNVTSTGSFAVSYSPNPVALSSTTGANATSTVTVTPTGGFTGPVTVTCPAPATLPPGVTCTAPPPIQVTSGPATGTLTLLVLATSTNLTASAAPAERTLYAAGVIPSGGGKGWWMLSAGTGLAAMYLLFLPGRKKYRAALGLGLICVLSFTLGCGGSGGGGGGPVVTTTSITVNSGKLASNDPTGFRFTISVNASVGANGQVQLFDGATALGTGVTVSNGSATITNAGLVPGTHSISAHYLGDANTRASSSGTLQVTVTTLPGPPVQLAITTSPAATPPAPSIGITIN
jgi:pro-kumamolisin-like protein/Big-like domain-containing protein